jgi:hypothetical protein
MTAIKNPFERRVLEAERKLIEAKHCVIIFNWLIEKELTESDAFRIVNAANWERILESKEFYDSEKYEFQRLVNQMRNEITAISGQIILAAI